MSKPPEDWTQQLEQTRRALEDMASLLGKYRDELELAGFTRDEALVMVTAYQQGLQNPPGEA